MTDFPVPMHIPGFVHASHVPASAVRPGLLILSDGLLILAGVDVWLGFQPNAEAWDEIAKRAAEMAQRFRDGTLAREGQRMADDLQHAMMAAAEPAGHG
jgi:hypothetical protein